LISTSNLSVQFGGRKLFDEVNIKFTEGNCYGIIGPNGAGKSTFLKVLTGELDSTSGEVIVEKNKRLSFLKQDHFAYEDEEVLNVVMMGHAKLYDIMLQKNALYALNSIFFYIPYSKLSNSLRNRTKETNMHLVMYFSHTIRDLSVFIFIQLI